MITLETLPIEKKWKQYLGPELNKDYMIQLNSFLKNQEKNKKNIYPNYDEVFKAFNQTPFESVKVVILGQDPYHGPDQAHGLCFSVKSGVKVPPSLVNIYKELKSDLDIPIPNHGCLESWAKQGVLLLNATLTVESGKAGSHQKKGWEEFTDKAIHALNDQKQNLVFVLWGSYAQKKGSFIDEKKHLVIRSAHPSPLSAYRGFFGSRPFSKINTYLEKNGKAPIEWSL